MDEPRSEEMPVELNQCVHDLYYDKQKRELRCRKCGNAWGGTRLNEVEQILKSSQKTL